MAKNDRQNSVFDVTGIIPGQKKTAQPIERVALEVEIKDARLNLKIKPSVKEKLYRLAEARGISATDLIEEMVNREFSERNT